MGRADAEDVIGTVLAAVAHGAGDCVVIEGPAGIGKSRMIAELAARADRMGVAVVAGCATGLDRIAPLSTLLTALGGSEPPVMTRSELASFDERQDGRYLLIDRVGGLLESYSHGRPLVISLDDVHRADELTALALRVLVPALRSSPILWVLARRPLPDRSPVQQAFDWLIAEGAHTLRLGPLSEAAVAELCDTVLGAVPRESLQALIEDSGGNPFLLESLLTALREGDRIRIQDGVATISDSGLPAGFLTAVDRRLRDLSDDARRLLDAGAVLGRPFTLHEVAGLVGEQAVRLLDPARESVEAGVLVDDRTAFRFRHDLVREAGYAGLSGPARQALHRTAADVLQAEGRPVAEVADHLIRGGSRGDPRTLAVVREAVTQMAPAAPGAGADLILAVLGTSGRHDPARSRLVADAVRLLATAGRLDQARALGESHLRQGLDPSTEAAVLLGLAEALKHAGQDGAAIGYTERALALPEVPPGERARLLAIRAHAMLQTDDMAGADAAGELSIEEGAAVGEHSAVVFGMEARSVAAYARGELTAAAGFAESGVRIADEVGGQARHRHPRLWQAMVLTAADRFDEAAEVFAADKAVADELGTAWSRPLWHHLQSHLWLALGRLDDAEAVAEAGLRVGEQLGATAVAPPLLATLSQVALRRGDLVGARDHLLRAQRLVDGGIGVIAEEMIWEQALYADATGRPDRALAALEPVFDGFPQRLYMLVNSRSAGPALVRMALRVGDVERANSAARAARSAADLNPVSPSLAGAATHAEGLLRADPDVLHAAVALLRESPRRHAGASAMEDCAAAEHAAGNRIPAVDLLVDAHARYSEMGAVHDAQRVQHRLHAIGGPIRRVRPRRPATGWESLTGSEQRIARLVAEGLTNRQIAARLYLSPHTVDSHIRHAFTKLNVSSRVALTRLVLTDDHR